MSCADLNAATDDMLDRVGIIADAKPGCGCEGESFSEYSPGVVAATETIMRVVCSPMHVHPKKAEVLPNFFSNVFNRGVSMQRLEMSKLADNVACVERLLQSRDDGVWLGFVQAPAQAIRAISLFDDGQSFCVADAALADNTAHAEVHLSRRIVETERIEYRQALMRVFNGKAVLSRRVLQGGSVWNGLREDLKGRPLPKQWEELDQRSIT